MSADIIDGAERAEGFDDAGRIAFCAGVEDAGDFIPSLPLFVLVNMLACFQIVPGIVWFPLQEYLIVEMTSS